MVKERGTYVIGTSIALSNSEHSCSQERASHPVGTSIRVVDFLKNLPVRRQAALKSSAPTLSKIRRTLKAYAIARPSTRFSLKVLKAKNEKDNWVYAPRAGACVSDAAIKVVGKEVAGQCEWMVSSQNDLQDLACSPAPDGSLTGRSPKRKDNYTIRAFLPKPRCGMHKMSRRRLTHLSNRCAQISQLLATAPITSP